MANMTIEQEVFDKHIFDFERLKKYGFEKKEKKYQKSIPFHDGQFQADLSIDKKGKITSKVIDLETGEEYLPLRVAMSTSAFVSEIREEYKNILKDIANHCTQEVYFHSDQANRLAIWIAKTYHETPDAPFQKYKGKVFRNHSNRKWYGLVQEVAEDKVVKNGAKDKNIEILNVKTEPETIQKLMARKGIYPGYHMKKDSWISILLDDSLRDEEIQQLIRRSRGYTGAYSPLAGELANDAWIIPSNPKIYDVTKALKKKKTEEWWQPASIEIGDTVYLYLTAPYSCVMYRFEVTARDLPNPYHNGRKIMRMKLTHTYEKGLLDRKVLAYYGVASVRGARRIPVKLKTELDKISSL